MPDGDSPERVLLDSYPFQSPLKCSRPQPVLFPVLCTPIGPALNRTAAFPGSACPNRRSSRRRSEEHTSELQSLTNLVCRLLLEKKKKKNTKHHKATAIKKD